ncbi:MAG: carboxypeptidase regulatory-like domain-containing protein, partial [Oscillibacter sp.]|nr:carboxypeptidase regulatory-like domain-containing protein [Oscillibacter sp.]
MRKRWLSLLLALVMLASVTVTTASADTVNLLDKTVTLSVTPSQSAICVGSTGDVYVKYTISIKADAPIPAFSFVVPTDGKLATQAQTNNSDWYYWFNTDELMQWDEAKETGGHGPYKVADYTPTTGYVGVGGSDGNGISAKTEVMTIVAKFPAGSTAETYTPAFADEDFIAGGGETIDSGGIKVSNAFGRRHVQVGSVNVKAGATVSGTVKDSSGKAVSGATVELYKDDTKVADATAGTDGKYTISNVSTGTYTVKAKSDDGSLNGSAPVTVTDGDTTKDITVAKGFTVSGTIKSYGSASEAVTVTMTKQGETTPTFTDTLTGASGSVPYSQTYSFPTVPAGTYTLKVMKKGHAPWTEEITVGDDNVTKDVTVYLWGDVNRDGKVTAADAQEIQRKAAGLSS